MPIAVAVPVQGESGELSQFLGQRVEARRGELENPSRL
jgi:hypothetical protein